MYFLQFCLFPPFKTWTGSDFVFVVIRGCQQIWLYVEFISVIICCIVFEFFDLTSFKLV